VRQIDFLPGTVVEGRFAHGQKITGLRERLGVPRVPAEIEILRLVPGVPEMKPPAEIEEQPLSCEVSLAGGAAVF
jgi:hypothetical protein